MVDIFRNIIAFVATFTVVMTVTMIVIHFGISVCTKTSRLTCRQEVISFWVGLTLALLLVPFYYLPC